MVHTQNISEMPKPVVIKEKITRKILRPVMAQFSSLSEALLELVDNAFDEFDGMHGGNHLNVDIVITKGSIEIENIGGRGMGVSELRNWLNWGESTKKDVIGEYGQGGKAAMGYLGSSWVVRVKRWNEPYLWEIKEDKWDDVSCAAKTYSAVPSKCDKWQDKGYCYFKIRKLKNHRQMLSRIKTEVSSIYSGYLNEGKANISINYDPLEPMKLPLYEGYKISKFRETSPLGLNVRGWIGRLKRDVRVRGESRITGGMRLLRKGRLICDGEYFGHHDYRYRASLGTLIGEVELPRVPILPNKTNFHRDSPERESVQGIMYRILKPHIEELLSQKEEEQVTREEKKRVSQVRNMMIDALKSLSRESELSSRFSEDKGRKKPTITRKQKEDAQIPESLEEKEITSGNKKPRTPPPEDAIGRLKRLGRMPDWELRILEPDIRSDWGEKEGHRCLLINKKFCLYEERKGDDLYIAETASLQLAKSEEEEKWNAPR